jgi:polyisoprenoid-binding protein YceI
MTEKTKTKWTVDPKHSNVQFKVKHLAISNVNGTFDVFQGNVQSEDEDFNHAKVQFVIDSDSINTNLEDRDKHLKSAEFFDTQKFPKITFEGSLQRKNNDYELAGELTIRETVKNIRMEAEFTGTGKGRFGDTRAGFEVNGKINRKDFGLTWNLLTETGSFVVGEEIKLRFDIQLVKQTT